MEKVVLYVRLGKTTKERLETLADSKEVSLSEYVRSVLINHIEADKFIKQQQLINPAMQTINPALAEIWRFMAIPKK